MANKKKKYVYDDRLSTGYSFLSRRLFIRYLGGWVAIPLLPSLLPKQSQAAVLDENAFRKAFFAVARHGGHPFDADPVGVNYQQVAPGILGGSLQNANLGLYYNQDYNDVKDKITVIRGLDIMTMNSHNYATPLAGSAYVPLSDTVGGAVPYERKSVFQDSIDVILSKSKKVYSSTPQVPILRVSASGGGSDSHSIENYHNTRTLKDYNTALDLVRSNIIIENNGGNVNSGPTEMDLANERKKKIIDHALLTLNATQKKGMIGREDKVKLDQYQTLLETLRERVPASGEGGGPVITSGGEMCKNIPTNGRDQGEKMAQLIVAAFSCGVTKIAYMLLPTGSDAFHKSVHGNNLQVNRDYTTKHLKEEGLPAAGYTMKLMDQVTEANGKTMLDNSICLVTSELAGARPRHHSMNMRVLLGGSLNGKLRTGMALDYMDHRFSSVWGKVQGDTSGKMVSPGRLYNELLISIAKGFGLTESEYQRDGRKGLGTYECAQTQKFCAYISKHVNMDFGRKLADHIQKNILDKGYNKDSTLPYYYKG